MPPETLVNRVRILEHNMQSLEGLPDRVASLEVQILQFRGEVRAEFSAVREEMRAEIRNGDEETRRQMRVLHEEVIARIALLEEHLNGRKPAAKTRSRTDSSRRRSPKR